jgi:hypothetical protein
MVRDLDGVLQFWNSGAEAFSIGTAQRFWQKRSSTTAYEISHLT